MLGIDPGTAACGFGVVAVGTGLRARLIECGVIRTRPVDPLPNRLLVIFDAVNELVERHQPDALALENVFHGRNTRTALVLGHARGVIMVVAERAGVPVAEITPAEVKRAVTGTGRATKDQVGAMVMRLLNLKRAPTPSDAADGVAIALTHLMRAMPRTRLGGGAP